MGEILYVVAMCSAWTVPFIFFLPHWFWMMLTIDGVLIVYEVVNKVKYGKTLSKQFWEWSVDKDESQNYKNFWKVLTITGLMLAGWLMLLLHLLWKLIFKKKTP